MSRVYPLALQDQLFPIELLSNGSALSSSVGTWDWCGSVSLYLELRMYVDTVVSIHPCRLFIAVIFEVLLMVYREFVACQNSRGILFLSIEVH